MSEINLGAIGSGTPVSSIEYDFYLNVPNKDEEVYFSYPVAFYHKDSVNESFIYLAAIMDIDSSQKKYINTDFTSLKALEIIKGLGDLSGNLHHIIVATQKIKGTKFLKAKYFSTAIINQIYMVNLPYFGFNSCRNEGYTILRENFLVTYP